MNKRLRNFSWLGFMLIAVFLTLIFHSPAIAQTPKHYTQLSFPPLPELQLPKYDRYQLKNGMVVYLMEDRQLPLVSGTAIIRTGSRLEPAAKMGLAEITGAVLRNGGTQQHPADELNELLEQRAAVVETGINTVSGNASFNALSEDTETVLNLFAEILRHPAFAPEQLELAKNQKRGEISRRNDNPGDIASREFQKLVYGDASPYARTVEYANLDNISREDIINFYQQYFRPDQIILGIVGDFDPAKMKPIIEKAFGDWQPPATQAQQSVPSASQKNQNGTFLVDRPQLTQSNILLGHMGGQLKSPDYPALSVLNGVMNGFGGRLFNDLRSRQGLAYSVYGYWSPNYDYPGTFIAGGQTRSETTVSFVQSLIAELKRLQSAPISEAELTFAKESILNSFVFNFENPSQTLSRLMRYEYFGYPKDFIFQYQRGIKAT
ncbi:MAG: M16 family metallopeptidase, partial [Microcystaceae cyanobacterium]